MTKTLLSYESESAPPRGRPLRRTLLPALALTALAVGVMPPTPAGAEPAPAVAGLGPTGAAPAGTDGLDVTRETRPVAPGAQLTSFSRLERDKWLRADALSVDLTSGTKVDYLDSGRTSRPQTVSEMAKQHDPGAGRRTVAAINADFFDINATGAALGPGVRDGRPTHSAEPGVTDAVGIGPQAAGRVLDLYFDGTLTLPGSTEPLRAYNAANVPADGIGAYNTQWGEADRALTVDGDPQVTEVSVRDGEVAGITGTPGKGPIAEGTTVLVGRGAGARTLAALRPGDPVSVEYRVKTDDGSPVPRTAVGGRGVLVVDGRPQNFEGQGNNAAAPRTAVGFSKDGSTMHVMSVDGRQAASGGVTLTELARMMAEVGAHSALNLDGGGSSTLLAREAGSDELLLENAPSDGSERQVPNGLALTAPDGSGALRGFHVETVMAPERAPTADNTPGGHPERVFVGLSRRLTAAGFDETYGPAEGDARWRTENDRVRKVGGGEGRGNRVGKVDGDGVFHARRAGTTTVTARDDSAEGSIELTVVGRLDRVRPTTERVALPDAEATGRIGFVGHAADGTSAPIDPDDVELDYDRALFTVTADRTTGAFTVRAARPDASGVVTATVGGRTTRFAVTVGSRQQRVADFTDGATWKFSHARAAGSLTPVPDGKEGAGLRMRYDFSLSTATRAAYATPAADIRVPGQPSSFSMWIKGDGKGAWPSLQVTDAVGTSHTLRAAHVDWTDWRQVTFAVPQGISYPLSVRRFYLAETRPPFQYTGDVVLDELVAQVPPVVDLPPEPTVEDPLISTAADAQGRDWRFAVVSDAQFVARQPDSAVVRQTRRTLREIKAARPDFVVIPGDWVDEGSPQDLAFARRVLEEELGDTPWYYVPGNHEVMGGKIDNFVAEFGPAQLTFDHEGTRFITLDTSSLTLRGGGYDQIQELRTQLDAAARDPEIGSVVVVQHVPPRDPSPQKASQLTDRLEADLLEDWLAGFQNDSGKGAVMINSHVGAFHASRVDGVPYLINGNTGKTPSTDADRGGFTGWTLVGVDRGVPRDGDWISAQTRAHVDALTLDAPVSLRVGAEADVRATVRQGETRAVPVAWPLSADWSGSKGLCVQDGPSKRPDRRCLATLDTEDGGIDAHRPGRVTVAVTVNGERAEHTIELTR